MGYKLVVTLMHTDFYNFLSTCFEFRWAQISKLTKSRFPVPQQFQDGAEEIYGCKEKVRELVRGFRKKGKKDKEMAQLLGKTVR